MDSFKIHGQVISDYRGYIESFINIRDEDIRAVVNEALSKGRLWPEPLIQFNPSYRMTGSLADLVQKEKLHPLLEDIFRGYRLYQHQVEALRLGTQPSDFIVTSGTGSGKSLTYLGTIFDFLLKSPQTGKVTSVIVYPMNALINSQVEEIERYQKGFEDHTGNPPILTKSEFVVVNALCQKGEIDVNELGLREYLQKEGETLQALSVSLNQKGLTTIKGDKLVLLTDECACMMIPGVGCVAAENKTGRLVRYAMKAMETRRRKEITTASNDASGGSKS
jgi:DEAD/DEAH box helicase